MSFDLETSSNGEVVTVVNPPNIRIEDLRGMKVLPNLAAEVTRQSKELHPHCCGDTDMCHSHLPEDKSPIKQLTGGDRMIARSLPKRTPMKPYPKQGNHVALPDDVIAEAQKKFDAQQRQLENLNKRFEKGKISEKNYLHQARSIMA